VLTNEACLLLLVAVTWGTLVHHPQLGLDQCGQAAGQLLPRSMDVAVAAECSADPSTTTAVGAEVGPESRQRRWVSWNQHSDGGMLPSARWSDRRATSEVSAGSHAPALGAGDQQVVGEVLLDLLLGGKRKNWTQL